MLRSALALLIVAGLAVAPATASVITGSLTTSNGGITAGGNYTNANGGFVISWTITNNGNGTWTYQYNFNRLNGGLVVGPGVSHIILELSPNFTQADLISTGSTIQTTTLGTFGAGPSNPGWPGGTLGGVKFDTTSNPSGITFTTNREPMWGSFYVKGGSSSFAYNADFNGPVVNKLDYTNPAVDSNGNPLRMILVPDTIPTPGALVALGLGGLVAARRRR
jgi:hypothetical protein